MRDVPDILEKIVARKRLELAQRTVSRDVLEQQAQSALADRRDFRGSLQNSTPAIIAEIKRASPSKGLLAAEVDPPAVAMEYQKGGAACLSVLTDEHFFHGSLDDLRAVRAAVDLPVLRKDFTIDEYHVVEAAASGADAILLIVAILAEREIRTFRTLAGQFNLSCLVEVHDEAELKIALDAGADIIGVNNRDLRTFDVTLETSLTLAAQIPGGVTLVSESGIHSRSDINRLSGVGFHAFLIGEHLMTSANRTQALRDMLDAS